MDNQTEMKQAIYRKPGSRGRAWHIQVMSNGQPAIGEIVEVVTKNGLKDHVRITGISSGGLWTFETVQRNVEGKATYASYNKATMHASGSDKESTGFDAEAFLGGSSGATDSELRSLVDSAKEAATRSETSAKASEAAFHKAWESIATIEQKAEKALAEAAARAVGIQVTYKNVEGDIMKCGRQHECFPDLLEWVSLGLNVWLPGPAGSGKTTAAGEVAKALGLAFHHTGKVLMEYSLLGFIDANGRYHSTPFRKAYEFGGVFLQDECDGSEAKALLALNMGIENDQMAFPDGIITRHKDFRLIAAANTFGLGGDSDYVGRNRLDGAFLDRFVTLPWGYDEEFELFLTLRQWQGATLWVKHVQALRRNAKARGVKCLITPRASLYGARMLAAGVSQAKVEQATIRKALSLEQWNSIQG